MLKGMKKQLKFFLSQPIFKNLMKTKYPTQSGKLLLPDLTGEHSQSALGALLKAPMRRKKKKIATSQITGPEWWRGWIWPFLVFALVLAFQCSDSPIHPFFSRLPTLEWFLLLPQFCPHTYQSMFKRLPTWVFMVPGSVCMLMKPNRPVWLCTSYAKCAIRKGGKLHVFGLGQDGNNWQRGQQVGQYRYLGKKPPFCKLIVLIQLVRREIQISTKNPYFLIV